MTSLEDRIATLEQEVQALRSRSTEKKVVQDSFLVLSNSGNPLLSVKETERGAELTLYDSVGRRIAVLGQAPNGGNGIAIYNPAGKRVAGLFADRDGGHLAIYDCDGDGVAGMHSTSDGGCLSVRECATGNHATLSAHACGATLGFFDAGVPILTFPMRGDGAPKG